MKKPGLSVAVSVGKSKTPASDLGSPADLGAPPSAADDDLSDDASDDDTDPSSGTVTLTVTREEATALASVLSQLQDQLGDSTGGDVDTGAGLSAASPYDRYGS